MATLNLDKILPTLEENSKTVRNTYISYLAAATFIWITIESVTHRMLLIPDERLTLPVIQVQIPVVGFFATAPALLLMFQLYFQIHVYNFARDLARERDGLQAEQIQELRNRLPGNLFTWNFLDSKNQNSLFGFLTHLIVSLTFYWYGALVLLRAQWVFLPHHYEAMTNWHRVLVLATVTISAWFAIKVWGLRYGEKDGSKNIIKLIKNRTKAIFDTSLPFSHPEGEYQGQEKTWAHFNFISGALFSCAGLYFFLSMTLCILIIPFDQEENGRRFNAFLFPIEITLACTLETLETNNDNTENTETETPCRHARQQLFYFSLSEKLTKEQREHLRINQVVARNLRLEEAKLALAPSDTMKAALMRQEEKKLSKEEMEKVFFEHYDRLDLKGRHLEFANFSRADIRNSDLREAHLQGADLMDAHLEGADLSFAYLQGANLGYAYLQGADLSFAQLEGAVLYRAQLEGADLRFAHLQGADLKGAHLQGADLKGAHLQGAVLYRAQLEGADLSFAHLQGADLTEAHLQGADLILARLQGAVLYRAQLEGADLSYAQLEGADLSYAQLEGADLGDAQLEGADLRKARLQGAMLQSAIVGPLKLDNKENNPEKWAEGLPEEKKKTFIERLRKLVQDKTSTQFPPLEEDNGEPIIAHNIQNSFTQLKDVKNPVPSLVDSKKLEELKKEWRKQLQNPGKKLTQEETRKREDKIKSIYSALFKMQRKTWDKLLCDFPILQKKKIVGNPYEIFPHAPYFSKEEVQAAIDRCDQKAN